MKKKYAFSVIELMIVTVIMLIILSAAIPGFRSFMRNSEAKTLASKFATSIRQAKNEAMRRGKKVSVCATAAGTATGAGVCLGSTTTWDSWKVFVNEAGDNSDGASDTPIQFVGDVATGVITDSGISPPIIGFNPSGFPYAGGNTVFTIRPSGCSGNNAKTVTLEMNGSVTVANTAC